MKQRPAAISLVLATAFLLSGAGRSVALQTTKYGVTVDQEKNVDFARLKTYAWTRTQPSSIETINAQIVAAVDRELGALGMTKGAPDHVDVLVTYLSLTRTDVNVEGKPDSKGLRPEYRVGTLAVAMLEPSSRRRLLRLRVDLPIDTQADKLEGAINHAVTLMFAEYPTRRRK